jgi:deoxyribonuclease V
MLISMKLRRLHPWETIRPVDAVVLQRTLAGKVNHRQPLGDYDLVAGADCSYSRFSPWFYAAVVLWRRSTGEVIEAAEAVGKSPFPYVPGLLSFREAPILLEAFAKLKRRPHLVMMDGQGRAHPRRIGVASHLGLFLGVPTIGCAKSLLLGTHDEPGLKRGATTSLFDKDEIIGQVVRTKDRCNPLYISPGHLIDLESSVRAVLECDGGYRLPEPTRQAHLHVNELRRRCREEGTIDDDQIGSIQGD